MAKIPNSESINLHIAIPSLGATSSPNVSVNSDGDNNDVNSTLIAGNPIDEDSWVMNLTGINSTLIAENLMNSCHIN